MSKTPETNVHTNETPTVPEHPTPSSTARDETPVEREIHAQAHADFLLHLHLAECAAREHALADFEREEAERHYGALTGLAYADGRVQGTESESTLLATPALSASIHPVTEAAWQRVLSARAVAEGAAGAAEVALMQAIDTLPSGPIGGQVWAASGVVSKVRRAHSKALDLIRYVRENV